MMTHADVTELADLYVLDALPDDVAEEIEAHLAECSGCQAVVDRAWDVAQLLRAAVPQAAPSPALHARLMRIVNDEAARSGREVVTPLPIAQPVLTRRGWLSAFGALRMVGAAAVLSVLLAGWLTVQVIGLQQQMHSTELTLARTWENGQDAMEIMSRAMQHGPGWVRVEGADMAPTASGMFYYVRNDNQGVLIVSGLPPLPQGEEYQCWLMSGENHMNGGTFYREDDGRGMLVIKAPMPLETLDALRVTSGPRGSATEPNGKSYLWARIKGT